MIDIIEGNILCAPDELVRKEALNHYFTDRIGRSAERVNQAMLAAIN